MNLFNRNNITLAICILTIGAIALCIYGGTIIGGLNY